MDLELQGKRACITGASLGIGLAVAEALATEGVDLFLCARDEPRLKEAGTAIVTRHGVAVHIVRCDVTSTQDVAILAGRVADEGGVDILVNNAGAGSQETIMDAPDERWQSYWDLHVMAAVRLVRSLVPGMRARGGGAIIDNASICARQPLDYEPIYNVTKAALAMFSKCLANERVGDGILVNAANAGLILTPDWRRTARELGRPGGQTADEYLDTIARDFAPIGRFGSPAEIADFIVFLCSPRSSYCVGGTYSVDGGALKVTNCADPGGRP